MICQVSGTLVLEGCSKPASLNVQGRSLPWLRLKAQSRTEHKPIAIATRRRATPISP
nr:MAG TPA: hypothetical protein [Caudoviricetes sp.]